MKRTLDEIERDVRRTVRQETLRAIRGRKILLAKSHANKKALLEKLLTHASQLADETSNKRQSQEYLARLRAEADNIRRRLPGWPGRTTRKMPREGSEGYLLRQRLKEVTGYSKELRPRIDAWQRRISRLRAVMDREKRELLKA
jgi:hypothetical protein